MNHFKRSLSILLVLILAFTLALPASAAAAYDVRVQNNTVQFLQNGYVSGSYTAADSDLKLMIDNAGDLLVCFNNTPGHAISVTLGNQRNLNLSGSINTLTLDSSFNGSLNSTALTNTMKINGSAAVTQKNGVGLLDISGASAVDIRNYTTINYARITSSNARVTIYAGSKLLSGEAASANNLICGSASGSVPAGTIGSLKITGKTSNSSGSSSSSSSTGSSSSSSNTLRLSSKTIYAYYGDHLRDIEDDLDKNVRATNANGARVYGTAEWVSASTTMLRRSTSFKYRFVPDDSRYRTTTGTIRVSVDDDDDYYNDRDDDYNRDYDYDLDIDTIYVSDSNYTLKELKSDLRNAVYATDSDTDKKVSGSFEWVDSDSTRVKESGSYQFVFRPSSSRYERRRDWVYIQVN